MKACLADCMCSPSSTTYTTVWLLVWVLNGRQDGLQLHSGIMKVKDSLPTTFRHVMVIDISTGCCQAMTLVTQPKLKVLHQSSGFSFILVCNLVYNVYNTSCFTQQWIHNNKSDLLLTIQLPNNHCTCMWLMTKYVDTCWSISHCYLDTMSYFCLLVLRKISTQ